MPPRPSLDPILGGYRRIPVAQIGADIFCDTRLITEEIARIANKPDLSFTTAPTNAVQFAERVNDTVFMPIVQAASPAKVLRKLAFQYWPWEIARLLKDRALVGKQSKLPRKRSADRKLAIAEFKTELESRSSESTFLFGDTPTIADFAAYHLVWFADQTQSSRFLRADTQASHWQQRMQKFGHAKHTRISRAQLFQTAKTSQPRAVPNEFNCTEGIGRPISIEPTDYAQGATSGILIGESQERWIIARETEQFGIIHVHFPKRGYQAK